jgi:VWFA-related protein
MNATKFCCLGLPYLTVWAAFGAQAPADVPPPAVFHSGIQLVQVSVVAEDEHGDPVTNLRREDFHLLDNGTPQEIRLFVGPEKSGPFAPGLATPGIFTNRVVPSGSHGGFSAILIDGVFTDFGDPDAGPGSANARLYALRSLRSIPAGESVAIYAMDRSGLQVISDFTSDRDLLTRRLNHWRPGTDTPATNVQVVDDVSAEMAKNSTAHRMIQTAEQSEARASVVRVDALRRADVLSSEMDMLLGQLARAPGPKHLIWLSNRFAMSGPTLRKFSSENVAIYPVHLAGVSISAACESCTDANKASMDSIAALTGGIAYRDRNDIDVVIREAVEDGRVSYTIGFYQSIDNKTAQAHDTQAHHVTVIAGQPGLTLRYRTIYQAEEASALAHADSADLARALSQPADLTAISIRASATRAQDRLNLKAVVDASALELRAEGNLWKGKIEIVARFNAADGRPVGDIVSQMLTLNMRQATYDAALEHGISVAKALQIPSKATQLKLLFANVALGKIGTLTIPLSEVGNDAIRIK